MKCPNCGAENPVGKKFCGDCGVMIPQPPPPPPVESIQPTAIQPKQSWLGVNWKMLVGVVVVLAIVLIAIGLIYTQPWSQIKVTIRNQKTFGLYVATYDNQKEMNRTFLPAGEEQTLASWSVVQGKHLVSIDVVPYMTYDGMVIIPIPTPSTPEEIAEALKKWNEDPFNFLDGTMDWSSVSDVGPLTKMDVLIEY